MLALAILNLACTEATGPGELKWRRRLQKLAAKLKNAPA